MAMHGNASKTLLNQILVLSKKCPPSYILCSSKGACNTLLPEGKTPTLEFLYFHDVNSSSVPIINRSNLFSKSPALSLVVHVR